MQIIIKKYEHYNRALGCYIKSKKHYERCMQEKGFISQEKASQIADDARERSIKPYIISEKTKTLIKAVVDHTDEKRNVKMSDRLIDGLKENGVKFNFYNKLPKNYEKGGFYAVDER